MEKLIAGIKKGNKEDIGEFIKLTQSSLFKFCYYLSGNRQIAEDLTHDSYIRLMTSIDQLNQPKLIVAWLKQIARNLYLDYVKSASQSKVHVEMSDEELSKSSLKNVEISMDQIDALRALHHLAESDRSILILADVQECSYQEVAQILNIAEGTVKSRLFRAREKFSSFFEGTNTRAHSS